MVPVKTEFVDFYEEAIRCQDLDRGPSVFKPTWICRKTDQPCGPANCPKHPWLRELITKTEPKAEPEIHETRNEMVESGPVFSRSSEKRAVLEPDLSSNSTSLSREETSPKISSRNHAKSKSKPHVKKGHVRRATITFFEKKSGELRRWGVDLCFAETARKTSILAFRKGRKGDDVRFYFGKGVGDENAKKCVKTWFANLATHDESASINQMGSPTPLSVDIIEEN